MSSNKKSTAMDEAAKPALVPKLRFPEFRGEEGWQTYVLEDLEAMGWVELGRGDVISAQDIKAIPGDYPIYSSSVKNNGLMGTYGRFMFDEELISWSVDGGGDFFHRPRHKFSVTNVSGYMRLKTSHLNYRFLASHLQALHASHTFDYQFKAHPSVIRKLYRLAIPTPAEQQKIAECLSSVDELMDAQARKVDALKTHKKGLMQQLFPREGETQPRLRFPEFQNTGDWEPKLLGDLVRSFKTGKLDANAMVENGQYRFYTCAKNYYQIDTFAFEGEALLVAGNGAHLGYIHHYIGKFNAYQRTYVLQQFEVNVVFLRYLLDRYLPARIQFEKKDGNTPYIVLSTLTEMPLVIPKDAAEQQRIATCLSSLDALITAETQKHEALKTHKKGLMQQLFPSPEEVGG
jgi:type I restriction enzyme S subunit